MKKYLICSILIPALLCSGCTSTKKTVYLQGIDEADLRFVDNNFNIRIQPGDNLHITVSSINTDASDIFNNMNTGSNVNNETLNILGYIVDDEGFINFPVLGKVPLGGLTKTQAISYMQERISEYIVNPIVNIRFLNFKVTVLGEVSKPGTYTIRDEKISLFEALGNAGDLTIYGKRDNVLICREANGEKVFHRVDLRSPDLFNSDYYYLQQNDIVYVQPNKARSGSSTYNQNLSIGVSVLSILITVVALIAKK